MALSIRKATTNDIRSVVALRTESEAWLHASGIHQWVDHERGVRSIHAGITEGTTYVVTDRSGEEIVASLALTGPDWDFWSIQDDPDNALYLYKLMITAKWRGTGLGDELLDWSCERTETDGKQWLRLDCWRTNTALHRYYEDRGFRHVRTDIVVGRGSGALFERPASLRMTTQSLITDTAPAT